MATNEWRAPSIGIWRRQTGRATRLGERLQALFDAERDQLPLWLPVGLGLGIAAWFALPDSRAWTAFLLALAYRSWQHTHDDDVQDDPEDERITALTHRRSAPARTGDE